MAQSAEALADWPALAERVEACLRASLPPAGKDRLVAAMEYALTGGGKRLRPLLVYHAGHIAGAPMERMDTVAVAVEMIHAYSLVHDDLPAMDDDELRRGRPTCHLAFDEATAILAGDALQTEAFAQLARLPHPDAGRSARMIATLADAAGARGMAGGQAMDLALTGQDSEIEILERLHGLKTAAIIRAALVLGALAADEANEELINALTRTGQAIGLAFQIQDDVLDVTGDTRTLGKSKGADAARDKPTFASVLGAEEATKRYRALYAEAMEEMEQFGEKARWLKELISQMEEREH